MDAGRWRPSRERWRDASRCSRRASPTSRTSPAPGSRAAQATDPATGRATCGSRCASPTAWRELLREPGRGAARGRARPHAGAASARQQARRERAAASRRCAHPRRRGLGRGRSCWRRSAGSGWRASRSTGSGFHAGERRRRVPLPTYPFERQRYWIEPPAAAATAPAARWQAAQRRPDLADWFYGAGLAGVRCCRPGPCRRRERSAGWCSPTAAGSARRRWQSGWRGRDEFGVLARGCRAIAGDHLRMLLRSCGSRPPVAHRPPGMCHARRRGTGRPRRIGKPGGVGLLQPPLAGPGPGRGERGGGGDPADAGAHRGGQMASWRSRATRP